MPEVTKHDPGAFSWVELATSDAAAAKKFYAALFGWTPVDQPSGPDMVYTIFEKNGKDVGAVYQIRPDQKGMPPNWGIYVTVPSADDAAKRAKDAGGKILMEPFEVMTFGRMAVIQDPQGAFFSVWQPRDHIGSEVWGEPNAPCWCELQTSDTEAAQKFYTAVFPWTAKVSPEYTEWHLNGKGIGGMMKIGPDWGPIPPHWTPYIQVEDTDAIFAKTKSLGGGAHLPPTDFPDVGRFSILHDTQGASFAVIKLAR
jgi:predicted enzyme related to lactoylglutathione lyase